MQSTRISYNKTRGTIMTETTGNYMSVLYISTIPELLKGPMKCKCMLTYVDL